MAQKTYARSFVEGQGGKLVKFDQQMIEVEPAHFVNEVSFPKIYDVQNGRIVRKSASQMLKQEAP